MSRVAHAFEDASLLAEAEAEVKQLARELETHQMVMHAMKQVYDAKVEDFAKETRRVSMLVGALREIRAVHRGGGNYHAYETLNIIAAVAEEAGVTL